MIRTSFKVLCGILLLFSIGQGVSAEEIRVRKVDGAKETLVFRILEMVMQKADPSVTFRHTLEDSNEARLVSEIQAGNLDVMWAGASPSNDEKMRAVRIPILKGLLGHRIFIIREEDKVAFSRVNSLADLKAYKAGQGRFWGDTQVLEHANLPTVTTIKYANLFPMLEGGRFDYFPRAVHEPWVEVEERPTLDLIVDSNLMLIYPYAMYFYVHQDNTRLQQIISRGMQIAIEDGSYDKMFFNDPMIKDVLQKADLPQRTVLRIENPFMHPDTPSQNSGYWLDINKL